ncbi:MAG: endonuclease III [Chloroflexota bacterium]|nr:endonuclease III [Chloroflexota bacterium]
MFPRESLKARRRRTLEIMERLRRAYPDAKCALHHRNAFELLVATILSAQCTDKRVNLTTPELFRRYPTPQALAAASPLEVAELIKPTGFYNNKTRSIQGAAHVLEEKFESAVPRSMHELLTLPGVARKTANVVLGTAYGVNEGVVVDTHVGRIARRLGLTREQDATKVEKDLMALVPREHWTDLAHMVIFHGRRCCTAQRPKCAACPVMELCPSAFKC